MRGGIVHVETRQQLLEALGPVAADGRAAVLVGGAGALDGPELAGLGSFFETLVGHLDRTCTTLLDGGTDAGVMRLVGETRMARGATFRLVGVLPRGMLDGRTRTGEKVRLGPGHTDYLAVPGERFGDEVAWLFAAADHLAARPAPTIVVNGGPLTLEEARRRLDDGRPVIAVAGSGRAADTLAADLDLRASGRLRVVPLDASALELAQALEGGEA